MVPAAAPPGRRSQTCPGSGSTLRKRSRRVPCGFPVTARAQARVLGGSAGRRTQSGGVCPRGRLRRGRPCPRGRPGPGRPRGPSPSVWPPAAPGANGRGPRPCRLTLRYRSGSAAGSAAPPPPGPHLPAPTGLTLEHFADPARASRGPGVSRARPRLCGRPHGHPPSPLPRARRPARAGLGLQGKVAEARVPLSISAQRLIYDVCSLPGVRAVGSGAPPRAWGAQRRAAAGAIPGNLIPVPRAGGGLGDRRPLARARAPGGARPSADSARSHPAPNPV